MDEQALTSEQKKQLGAQYTSKALSGALSGAVAGSTLGAGGSVAGAVIGGVIGAAAPLLGLSSDMKAFKELNKAQKKAERDQVLSLEKARRKDTQKGLLAQGGETGQRFVSASEAADFSSLGPATQYDTLMGRTYGV